MATVEQIVTEVVSHQFSRAQYEDYIKGRINDAQGYITLQTDFREFFTTEPIAVVPGTSTYTLPSDFQRLYDLISVNGSGQVFKLYQEPLVELETRPIASGEPTHYTVKGNTLKLWPTPENANTISLRYYREPDTISSNSDVPEVPTQYHRLLVSYCLWHCFERENDFNAAQYHKARFDEDLLKARGEAQYDTDDYTQEKRIGDFRTDPLAPNIWIV
jgi:hypothetical protein